MQLDVDQFYGIEIEEFPAQIAQVALWLTDHQMNMLVSEEFGQYFRRLPLKHAAKIHCGNALRMDWNEVVSVYDVDYILGNPPFVGKKEQSVQQKADMALIFGDVKGSGVLDYVTAWYMKAVHYVREEKLLSFPQAERVGNPSYSPLAKGAEGVVKKDSGQAGMTDNKNLLDALSGPSPRDHIKIAFVSTNSITQGEQVGVFWNELLRLGIHIHFAHRTFRWSNEARGKAAVHCVIVGFALHDTGHKIIFDYEDINGEPHALEARNINPYLVDAPDVLLMKRTTPVCPAPPINYGSMAIDNGHLILEEADYKSILKEYPASATWIRQYVGGEELLNGTKRWCLWFENITPQELRQLPPVIERVERVKQFRATSGRATTVELANYPTLFGERRQPKTQYLAIPKVSSENRPYLPIALLQPNVIANGSLLVIPDPGLYSFGVLCSRMHMAWMRYVAGRMKSDYQYSKPNRLQQLPLAGNTDKQ